jgi:hypothetical protein
MRIAIIEIKGIPARFGGFESALHELSRGLVKRGHSIGIKLERATVGRAPTDKHSGQRQADSFPLTNDEVQPVAD